MNKQKRSELVTTVLGIVLMIIGIILLAPYIWSFLQIFLGIGCLLLGIFFFMSRKHSLRFYRF